MRIGSESESDLYTTGASAASGSFRCTRETLSRISFAAASRSVPTSNSARIVELPSELVDVRDLMPDALLMDASRISVTSVSTTAAFAPE